MPSAVVFSTASTTASMAYTLSELQVVLGHQGPVLGDGLVEVMLCLLFPVRSLTLPTQ